MNWAAVYLVVYAVLTTWSDTITIAEEGRYSGAERTGVVIAMALNIAAIMCAWSLR